jgi:FkbM family methyltransferase
MDASAVLLANGHLRVKRTRHGLMAYNVNDQYIGRSLDCYGEYSPGEAQLFAQVVAPNALVVDVGANIGALTLPLARAAGPNGLVVAVEPQRAAYQLLCANLALNEIGNVRTVQAAAGQGPGRGFLKTADYAVSGNFGGIGLSEDGGEAIEIVSIDGLALPQCHFIKIDVEGAEQAVIAGADETIARFRPALYVENDRRQKSPDLIRQLRALDYTLYWHLPPLFSAENLYGNPTNLWPGIVSIDMLCLPREDKRQVVGMDAVTGPEDWPFR